jgi:hypothetical protein
MAGTSNFGGISFGSNTFNPVKNNENIMDIERGDNWSKNNKHFKTCNITVSTNPKKQVVVDGIIKDPLRSTLLSVGKQIYVQYWASSPPDSRHSFSGSGLPFPNEEMAYSNSPNVGRALLGNDGSFSIKLLYPNSYYKTLGSDYVKPNVKILFSDENGNMYGKIVTVILGDGIPYRSLTWNRKRNWLAGPMFYSGTDKLPARTQFQILESSYYPVKEYKNFWGLRPPLPEG